MTACRGAPAPSRAEARYGGTSVRAPLVPAAPAEGGDHMESPLLDSNDGPHAQRRLDGKSWEGTLRGPGFVKQPCVGVIRQETPLAGRPDGAAGKSVYPILEQKTNLSRSSSPVDFGAAVRKQRED